MSIFWAFSKQAARRIKLKQEKMSQNSYYWSIHKSLILTWCNGRCVYQTNATALQETIQKNTAEQN